MGWELPIIEVVSEKETKLLEAVNIKYLFLKNVYFQRCIQFVYLVTLADILFVRTWYQVRIPKFYNPVTSLLLSNEAKTSWKGMKTVGQLRKEQGVKPPIKEDSLYKVNY